MGPGSRIKGSKRHRIPDPDPQHCPHCSHWLDPDSNSACHVDADPDPIFHIMRIWIQLITLMRIRILPFKFDADPDPQHCFPQAYSGWWLCSGGAGWPLARRHGGCQWRGHRPLRPQVQKTIFHQGCGSAFISSGSGSSILGWIPIRIRIQGFNLMTKNWKKITAEKKKKFFWSKTTIYLFLSLHKERPSYRRSLQLSKEAIQHFRTWTLRKNFYFWGSFLPSWIRIRIPDPDTLTRLESGYGSGSATLYSTLKNKTLVTCYLARWVQSSV